MTADRQHYISFLLRIWSTSRDKRVVWQASLEAPDTGERTGFTDLLEMYTFLEGQIDHLSNQENIDRPKKSSSYRLTGKNDVARNNSRKTKI